jgi:hypothetical protein
MDDWKNALFHPPFHQKWCGTLRPHDNLLLKNLQNLLHENLRGKTTLSPIVVRAKALVKFLRCRAA